MSDNLENKTSDHTEEPQIEEDAKPSGSTPRKRSIFTLRNFLIVLGLSGAGLLLLLAIAAIVFRIGYVDSYVKNQFFAAFDEMGITMSADKFELSAYPLNLRLENALFKNKKTGAKLVEIKNANLALTILDIFAFSRIRNVSIDRTEINGLDVWILIDKDGKSNFDGIEILPPKNNVRVLYASASVALRDGRVHFGDDVRSISGSARNVALFLKPDAIRPADSKDVAYFFDLTSDGSTFTYDKSRLEPVNISASGRLHGGGVDISKLELKTPVGTSLLSGTVKNWSKPLYDLTIFSTLDLTQASNTFPLGTSITGVGNFTGKVSGEGLKYKITGEVTSDSLAASNIRLKGLKINADANGEGSMYEANGKAIAELLTFEDFRIEFPSLIGSVRGTGSDFKWFGELQAAAVNSPLGTIGSLIIDDAVAEYEDNRLVATLGNVRARRFSNDSVNLESIQTRNIRINYANGAVDAQIPNLTADRLNVDNAQMRGVEVTRARVKNKSGTTSVDAEAVKVDDYQSDDTKLKNTRADNVKLTNRNGVTNVTAGRVETDQVIAGSSVTKGVSVSNVKVDTDRRETRVNTGDVRIARVETDAAILANLNIAGVRLTVRDGVISGETSDFSAGDIDLRGNGSLSQVTARKPVFVLEPSGRYRASLDMSLGGGVIGNVRLGAAKASVIADNDVIALNKLTADVMDGKIEGNAKIAISNNRRSEINADFRDLDLSKLLAIQGGRIVPLEGKTNGRAELSFQGTNFKRASGNLTADIEATAGTEERGFIPVTGRFGATAIDGLFDIDFASLNTQHSTLNADGQFDLNGNSSDLLLALNSSDASEIERILRVLSISPELEQQLDTYKISLAGGLAFNGKLTGDLSNPTLNGRTSLASLIVRGKDLGTLVTSFNASPDGVQIKDGILQARDGGSVDFGIDIPFYGSNNTAVRATLNNINLANLVALIPVESIPEQLRDIQGKSTGRLELTGLPNEMRGDAELLTLNGTINGQSFENLVSNAVFEGPVVRLTKFEAGFGTGSLSVNGFYRSDTTEFDFDAKAVSIPAEKILAFAPRSDSVPEIDGDLNVTAKVTGRTSDTSTFDIRFSGSGTDVAINKSRFGTIDFKGTTDDRILNATASTNFGGRKQPITASLDFGNDRLPLNIETTLDRSPITPFLAIFRPNDSDSVSITGEVSGRVSVAGDLTPIDAAGNRPFTWNNLKGTANLSQFALQFDETPLAATEPVVLTFSTSELVFENARFAGAGSNLVVSGTKAFTDSGINNLVIDGKINLGIARAFSRSTFKNIFLSGVADIAVRLSGVNRTARLNGTATIENGSAATFVGSNRVTFERINGRVRFTTNQVQIEQITASLGGGKITASGGALLNDRLALDRIRLEIRGTNVTVPLPADFITTGNANIEINGRLIGNTFGSFVSGTVVARRSVYRKDIDLADFVSSRRDSSLAQSVDSGSAGEIIYSPPRLDIRIIGRDAVSIRNNLADLSASADLRLTGDTELPRLSGRITANSGTIFFRDDRYEVQRAVLSFPPNSSIEPRINLQAETVKRGYQIFINLSGSLTDTESLNAVVSSNPSLPQSDIISLITTGSLSNTTDGIPTIAQGGLNTAAEILADEIINKPIARATDKLFGLNRFELDPIVSGNRGNPSARLTVGRQINRNLLATYSTNLSQDQNQVLALEYRVSNRLSFVAAYEQRSLSNVTQNRNKFSFEIRLRKRF